MKGGNKAKLVVAVVATGAATVVVICYYGIRLTSYSSAEGLLDVTSSPYLSLLSVLVVDAFVLMISFLLCLGSGPCNRRCCCFRHSWLRLVRLQSLVLELFDETLTT